MGRRLLLCLAWLVLLPWPSATGQGPPQTTWSLDDPTGDLAAPTPGQAAPFVDIVHADGRFLDEAMELRIQVADLQSDAAAYTSWELWLAFDYRDTRFDLVLEGSTTSVDVPDAVEESVFGERGARLYRMTGGATQLAVVATGVDAGARTFNATLPWQTIVVDGFTPQPGEPLRLIEVASAWSPYVLGTPHNPAPVDGLSVVVTDAAAFPDGATLTVPGAVGDLSLATPQAVRYSNGEATTFHWPVQATNHGDAPMDLAFTMDQGVATEVRYPPGLRLDAGQTKTVSVFATVPFMHEHGTHRAFPLTARSAGNDRATLQLAVDYPRIPQPAGHHPDLWLHGGDVDLFSLGLRSIPYGLWMNTLEDDEASTATLYSPGLAICPHVTGDPATTLNSGLGWGFPLDPGLRIGLDGRMDEPASLDLSLQGLAALPPGTLHARLEVQSNDTGLLDFGDVTAPWIGHAAVPATPGPTAVPLHLEFPLPPGLDLVAPGTDSIVLQVAYCTDLPGPAAFAFATAAAFASVTDAPLFLLPGAHLRMPLSEYHDVLPVLGTGGPALATDEPLRRARPGATVLWHVQAQFPAGDDGDYEIRLLGQGASDATLLGPASTTGATQALDIPVSLLVPDAADGTTLDLLLDVTDRYDPGKTAALRLAVVVDPMSGLDQADEAAALQAPVKQSPGLPTVAALLGLLASAGLARRRS